MIAMNEIKQTREEIEACKMLEEGDIKRSLARDPDEFRRDQGIQRKHRQLVEYENQQQPAFQPKILPKSDMLARNSGRCAEPVSNRLYTVRSVNSESLTDSTESTQKASIKTRAFLHRQEAYRTARKQHDDIRLRLAYKDCSFTPRLSPKSELISSRYRGAESTSKFIKRLAYDDVMKRRETDENRQRLEKNLNRFVPRIDPLSDALALCLREDGDQPAHVRLFARRRAHEKSDTGSIVTEVDSKIPMKERRKSSAYSHVRSRYDMRNPGESLAAIDRARRERDLRHEIHRNQEDLREMEACTFQPNTSKGRIRLRDSTVLIPGLDRFLTLRQRPLEKDIGERPKSAGSLLTVPNPFMFRSRSHVSLYSSN
jgi:hypothetical protein